MINANPATDIMTSKNTIDSSFLSCLVNGKSVFVAKGCGVVIDTD